MLEGKVRHSWQRGCCVSCGICGSYPQVFERAMHGLLVSYTLFLGAEGRGGTRQPEGLSSQFRLGRVCFREQLGAG